MRRPPAGIPVLDEHLRRLAWQVDGGELVLGTATVYGATPPARYHRPERILDNASRKLNTIQRGAATAPGPAFEFDRTATW